MENNHEACGGDGVSRLHEISIVIVTYKGDEVLAPCLASLKAFYRRGTFQLIVVDNSPSDATRKIVEDFPEAIYVPSPGNPGFAGGNNIGLPYCTKKYVLLLNNDTIVKSASALEAMARFLEEHPKCGIVQGSITLPRLNGHAGGCGSYLTPLGIQYARGFDVSTELPQFNAACRCFSVMGAFMMFRRRLTDPENPDGAGFLFYDHFRSYYEESDFCHRVYLAGYEAWYLPTEPIEHLCGYTAGMFDYVGIMRQYVRNTLFSLLVNLGFVSRLWVVPLFCMVIFAHGLLHLARGNAAMFKADLGVFREIAASRRDINQARAKLNRRISDFSLFCKVMRCPPPSYFMRTIKSSI